MCICLLDRHLDAFTNFMLPMGAGDKDFQVEVQVICFDSYGSFSKIKMTAKVEPKNEPIAAVRKCF